MGRRSHSFTIWQRRGEEEEEALAISLSDRKEEDEVTEVVPAVRLGV
jgi:hypothetical protein